MNTKTITANNTNQDKKCIMSVFTIFSNKNSVANDFSELKTDLHSHLIPGIDDGSQTLEESISIIKRFKDLGFKKIITSPHINDAYQNNSEIILSGLDNLKKEVQNQQIDIEIEATAEYYIDYSFSEKLAGEKLMPFGDNYLLVELPFMNPLSISNEIIFDLQIKGYKIILAHPERYLYAIDDFSFYTDLKNKGVMFQINAVSLLGFYSYKVKKNAEKLIDNNMVEFAGSDAHGLVFLEKYKKLLSNKHFIKLYESGRLMNSKL